jgi:hypothetical protein
MNEITTHIEGKPLAIALPTEWLEEYQDNTQLRDAAAASLKSSKNDTPLVVSPEEVTLACLQESRV